MKPEKLYPSQLTSASMMSYEDFPTHKLLMTGDEKHDFRSESTLDVLWGLTERVLNVDPQAPDDPGLDRFLLSKGQDSMACNAVLAAKEFIPMEALPMLGSCDWIPGQHPDHSLIPGGEVSSRSPGHGVRYRCSAFTRLALLARLFCRSVRSSNVVR